MAVATLAGEPNELPPSVDFRMRSVSLAVPHPSTQMTYTSPAGPTATEQPWRVVPVDTTTEEAKVRGLFALLVDRVKRSVPVALSFQHTYTRPSYLVPVESTSIHGLSGTAVLRSCR